MLETMTSQKFDNFFNQKKNLKKNQKYILCVTC